MRIGLFIFRSVEAGFPELVIATVELPGTQGLTPFFVLAIAR